MRMSNNAKQLVMAIAQKDSEEIEKLFHHTENLGQAMQLIDETPDELDIKVTLAHRNQPLASLHIVDEKNTDGIAELLKEQYEATRAELAALLSRYSLTVEDLKGHAKL